MTSHLTLCNLHYNLGCVLHQQGDLSASADHYRQAIALQPTFVEAYHNLGVVLDEQGQRQAAVATYQQAIALQPTYILAYSNLGCSLVKLEQLDSAAQVFQKAIVLQPDWATLHNNLGQTWFALGQVDDAIAAFQQAIELQPDLDMSWHNLGRVMQHQGRHAQAVEYFQQAIRLAPDPIAAYSDCAVSWMSQNQLDQAMVCLQRAIAPQMPLVEAYCTWAERLIDEDERTRAIRACSRFLRALQQSAPTVELRTHLAQTYVHLGNVATAYGGTPQYRQAEALYQKALHLNPHYLDAYLYLGHCLTHQGRLEAAIIIYHLALTLQPNHPQPHLQLGNILVKQCHLEDAIAHYRQALQLENGDGTVQPMFHPHLPTALTPPLPHDRLIIPASNETTRPLSPPSPSNSIPSPETIYPSTWEWISNTSSTIHNSAISSAIHNYIPISLPHSSPIPAIPPIPSPASSCNGLNCVPCLQQLIRHFESTQIANGVHTISTDRPIGVDPLPTFVASIPNGRAWVVPQQNDWLVCNAIAILTPDNGLLADLSRDYPGQLPGCKNHDPTQHQIFSQDALPPLEVVDGTVAVLAGLSGHIYFHWMVDILPRFELLRRSGVEWSQIDWFLVNNYQQPFQRDTLNRLGIPLEKVLPSDRHPHIQAIRLLVPSFAGHLGWIHPWALDWLRQEFLPASVPDPTSPTPPYPDRIYISRAHARHRRVVNEQEVVEQLHQWGFVTLALESLSLADQASLFAHASVIIAPHGSGLTNILFCRPGTVVIELVSPHYIRPYYWTISNHLGLKHYYLPGELFTCYPLRDLMYPNPLLEDIVVNLAALQRIVQILDLAD